MKVQSSELKSGRLLGKGSSGIVYETTWQGQSCARKDFLRAPSDIFEREAAVLVALEDHPNVARTYCWAVDHGSCSLVSELAEDDLLNIMRKRIKASRRKSLGTQKSKSHLILDLAKFIEDCKNSTSPVITESSESSHPFTVPDALHVIVQIAQGMKCLHDNKVVHGDLKPKNVLIVTPGGSFVPNSLAFHVKVADFGLVETKMKSRTMLPRQARSWEMLRWRAPELLDLRTFDQSDPADSDSDDGRIGVHLHKFTYASDVYNFALTCSQILTGEDPYLGLGMGDLVSQKTPLRTGLSQRLPPTCRPQLCDLLEACLGETTERPNFQVILSKLEDVQQSLIAGPSTEDSENLDHVTRPTGNLESLIHDDLRIGIKENSEFTRTGDSKNLVITRTGETSDISSQKDQIILKKVPESYTSSDSAKRTSIPEQRTMDAHQSSKFGRMEPRHFLGLDEEITWETRGIPTRNMPALRTLTDLDALIFAMKDYPTVVISVEEVRLFDAANLEAVRFRFPRRFYHSTDDFEERMIRYNHVHRLKVIRAITKDSDSTLKTVSFIPNELDYIDEGLISVLRQCWRIELSEFCANLYRNPNLRNLHIATTLSKGEGFRIDQLLNSSLVEISLPQMQEQGWRALALGLATNRSLRVLKLVWDAKGMETFMETRRSAGQDVDNISDYKNLTWPMCNKTLETLVIACHDFDLRSDSESVASILHRASCVSTFVVECHPPAFMKFTPFANCLRGALVKNRNVRALHLHVPFHGEDVELILMPLIASGNSSSSPENTTLTDLVLASDWWTKADLNEVGSMLRHNNSITHFGIRQLNPKKKLGVWKSPQRIRKPHIVEFLNGLCMNSTLRTLSLRGWSMIDGKDVLNAVLMLLRIQEALDIDLTGTGLAVKSKIMEPVHSQLQKNRASSGAMAPSVSYLVTTTTSLASSCPRGSGSETASPNLSFAPQDSAISEESELYNDDDDSNPASGRLIATPTSLDDNYPNSSYPAAQPGTFFSPFTYAQLAAATAGFQTPLGEGGFGVVFQGELPNGTRIAVKYLKLTSRVSAARRSFTAEVHTLGLIHHVNLVRLLGYCAEHDHRLMLVYEFMANSSLDKWIYGDDPARVLDWATRKRIAIGVARGLAYLHVGCIHTIVHLDVKPQNILLDANLNPKLADFGIAKLLDLGEPLGKITKARGTRAYMAPEIHQNFSVSAKTDVYSFGVLLVEIIRGKRNHDAALQGDESGRRFFPSWAKDLFHRGWFLDVVVPDLAASLPFVPGFHVDEARKLLLLAIACIHDDMDRRPDMKTVLLMLEGEKDVPSPPTTS